MPKSPASTSITASAPRQWSRSTPWSAGIEANSRRSTSTENTYIVFSSDNGFHMGQHELLRGQDDRVRHRRASAADRGRAGVPHGRVMHQVTQNVDLAPTFAALAGGTPDPSADGRSLVALLHGEQPSWRTAALVEHRGRTLGPGDPDYIDAKGDGDPMTYKAIRVSAPRLAHFRGPVEAVGSATATASASSTTSGATRSSARTARARSARPSGASSTGSCPGSPAATGPPRVGRRGSQAPVLLRGHPT